MYYCKIIPYINLCSLDTNDCTLYILSFLLCSLFSYMFQENQPGNVPAGSNEEMNKANSL